MNAAAPAGAPGRVGPRPLPLHLALAGMSLTSSIAGSALLKSGSPIWSRELAPRAEELAAHLREVDPQRWQAAVLGEVGRRGEAFLNGLRAYWAHPYRRELADPPVLWQEGTTRLLDYGAPGAADRGQPLLLAVPSLINRGYILDLSRERSLLRWLAGRGVRPLLVDWGAPGPEEAGFSLTDYVAGRLEAALDVARGLDGPPPVLLGYCMGGLLALALAARRRRDVAGLALLATPWDFHGGGQQQASLLATAMQALVPLFDSWGAMPVDVIQALFASLDPCLGLRKFAAFSRLDPDSEHARAFVALEDWLNDGVPLTAPVARECLIGWYGENKPLRGAWRIAGRPVDATALDLPTLCLVPRRDRIVPPDAARALAAALPQVTLMTPPVGHIGMIVSGAAPESVWRPLGDWIAGLGGPAGAAAAKTEATTKESGRQDGAAARPAATQAAPRPGDEARSRRRAGRGGARRS